MKYRCPRCKGISRPCDLCDGTGILELIPILDECEHTWAQTNVTTIDGYCEHHVGMVCTKCGARG